MSLPEALQHNRRPAGGWKPFLPALLLMSTLAAAPVPPPNSALRWSPLPPLPSPLGVAGPFSGVSGDALLVGGGANFPDRMPWAGGKKIWRDEVYALVGDAGGWTVVGKLPHPLAYGVSVTTPAGVVCIGGSDAGRHYREVFLMNYDHGMFSVQPLPDLPLPLANAAGALVGSTIYLAGGTETPGEQSALNRCFALEMGGKNAAWTAVEPCPGKARLLPVAAAWEDGFYLFGGAALEPAGGKVARVYLRDAWRYQPGHGWQRLADLPRPCVAGPTPAPHLDSRFLLVGGDDGSRAGFQPLEQHPGFPQTGLAYDLPTDRWCTNGDLPAPRATVPAVFWRGRFVIPSGEMRPGVRSPEVWSFRAVGTP